MIHYNKGKAGTVETIPLCKQKTRDRTEWSMRSYTRDRIRVTCKNCIRQLDKPPVIRSSVREINVWKVHEIRYIEAHYKTTSIRELAASLNRKFHSVRACVDRVKLLHRGQDNG